MLKGFELRWLGHTVDVNNFNGRSEGRSRKSRLAYIYIAPVSFLSSIIITIIIPQSPFSLNKIAVRLTIVDLFCCNSSSGIILVGTIFESV
jgi:hypothetical protein